MDTSDGHYLEIVKAGIQAPSADNSQPWLFSIGNGTIDVRPDPSRIGMFFDSAYSATFMSLGAVCENMKLCANKLGFHAEVVFDNAQDLAQSRGFTLSLRNGLQECDPLADAIHARMTNRSLFKRGDYVDDATLTGISEAVLPDSGCYVHWAEDSAASKRLAHAVLLADLVRFTHPLIHRDFHDKLRFGHAGAVARDGLDPSTLGLEKVLLPFLKWLRPWGLSNFLNKFGLHYIMAWRGGLLPMWASSRIGVISADAGVGYFDMGRAFERVWLAATLAGLAFQPLGALPLLLFRVTDQVGEGLSEGHLSKLRAADVAWRAAIGGAVSQARLVMIFRVGMADGAAQRSKRRELEVFLR